MARTPSPASSAFFGPVMRTNLLSPVSPSTLSLAAELIMGDRSGTPFLPSPQHHSRSPSPSALSQASFSMAMQQLSIHPDEVNARSSVPQDSNSRSSSSDVSVSSNTARPEAMFPVFTEPPPLPPAAAYRLREATSTDVDSIIALTAALDMTHATSFMWPKEELERRILQRDPLVVVAVVDETNEVAGCAGIDTLGMGNKQLTVYAVGSRVVPAKAMEQYTFPSSYCNCRGLLIHPNHQGAGLGSKLHRTRLEMLAQVAPETPAVVLSARGTTFDEAVATLGPLLRDNSAEVTPQFTKDTVFEFTFQTSKGIVHLAHHREGDGWRFVGVDVSDGGPVWCTSIPITKLIASYPTSRRPTAAFLEPLFATSSAG